jgi:hypothetical protein
MPLKPFMPSLTADGSGGFVIAWMAFPSGPNYSCYVQHIDENGQTQWTPNGINVSDSVQFHHTYPKVAYLPEHGETFVFWNELRIYSGTDFSNGIFGQKFDSSGESQWQPGGMMLDGMYQVSDTLIILQNICPGRSDEITLFIGKEFLQVESSDNLIISKYHAMKINRDGQLAWNAGKPLISNAPSSKLRFENSALVGDQWVLVWADNRNDPTHSDITGIYAQNLNIEGGAGLTAIDDFFPVRQGSITAMPNPFSNSVLIRFEVPDSGSVKIDLYTMDGSLVCNVINTHQRPGTSSVELETASLAKGMYLLRMKTPDGVSMHKIVK